MEVPCPYCRHMVPLRQHEHCPRCGCEIAMLGHILQAAHDSLQLGLLALYEARYTDACDLAEEAWGLKRCREATAIGLMGAVALEEVSAPVLPRNFHYTIILFPIYTLMHVQSNNASIS